MVAENPTGLESVKVLETVCNADDKEMKNITMTVIFTDTAHDKVVRKTVVEGVDLFLDGAIPAEFDAEYIKRDDYTKNISRRDNSG